MHQIVDLFCVFDFNLPSASFQVRIFFRLIAFLSINSRQSDAGENNWVTFVIENHTSKTLYLTDVHLMYGKWYRTSCKACELRTVEQTIGPGSHTLVNAAGRLLSPTGAEAEFAIYDGPKKETSTTQIMHLYFSIPFLVGAENTVNAKPFAPQQYPVESE